MSDQQARMPKTVKFLENKDLNSSRFGQSLKLNLENIQTPTKNLQTLQSEQTESKQKTQNQEDQLDIPVRKLNYADKDQNQNLENVQENELSKSEYYDNLNQNIKKKQAEQDIKDEKLGSKDQSNQEFSEKQQTDVQDQNPKSSNENQDKQNIESNGQAKQQILEQVHDNFEQTQLMKSRCGFPFAAGIDFSQLQIKQKQNQSMMVQTQSNRGNNQRAMMAKSQYIENSQKNNQIIPEDQPKSGMISQTSSISQQKNLFSHQKKQANYIKDKENQSGERPVILQNFDIDRFKGRVHDIYKGHYEIICGLLDKILLLYYIYQPYQQQIYILQIISPSSNKVITCSPDAFCYEWDLKYPSEKEQEPQPVQPEQDIKSESGQYEKQSQASYQPVQQTKPKNPTSIHNNNISIKNQNNFNKIAIIDIIALQNQNYIMVDSDMNLIYRCENNRQFSRNFLQDYIFIYFRNFHTALIQDKVPATTAVSLTRINHFTFILVSNVLEEPQVLQQAYDHTQEKSLKNRGVITLYQSGSSKWNDPHPRKFQRISSFYAHDNFMVKGSIALIDENNIISVGSDNFIRLWSLPEEMISEFMINSQSCAICVEVLATLDEGSTIQTVLGHRNGEISLWVIKIIDQNGYKYAYFNQLQIFDAHQKIITSILRISPQLVVSTSSDSSIKIWIYDKKRNILRIKRELTAHENHVSSICVVDEVTLASTGYDQQIIIWR